MTKLKTIRDAAGLSQTQLAAKAGVPVRMIRAYEAEAETARKDINKAAAMTVWRLAQALGCCVGDLIGKGETICTAYQAEKPLKG